MAKRVMVEVTKPDIERYDNPLGGFVEYMTHMDNERDDLGVVNDARSSFRAVSDKLNDKDISIVNHMAREAHKSPFYQSKIKFRVEAPLYVRTQLWRHMIDMGVCTDIPNANEVSRRYKKDKPKIQHITEYRSKPPESIKQGSGLPIDKELNDKLVAKFEENTKRQNDFYQELISCGICPEQARASLTEATLTQWTWTCSLFGVFNMYQQRLDHNAQPETRWYAEKIGLIAADLFPVAWSMLVKWGITIPKEEKAELEAYRVFLGDLKKVVDQDVLYRLDLLELIDSLEDKIKGIKENE